MAIDMAALDRAAQGDSDERVTVRKAWLREVHRKLSAADQLQAELARTKRGNQIFESIFGRTVRGL